MDIYLTNSLTKKKEKFSAINPPKVGLYTCGMTVYDYAHIGHGRKYVMDDILRRTLVASEYEVTHVQNVTDVGHLVSDGDEGEDKLEKGAKKHGKSVWDVATEFTNHFYTSMDQLNNLRPDIICKATEHIGEQIELIEKLMAKGYAYDTPEAVYFDVSKFPSYGAFTNQKLEEKKVAVRDEVETGEHKRNPADFALWFKRVGRFEDHTMHWESPWGDGFPGWHVECSAMSMKYLGEQFDIHTGGEDHLPVHHPNEIAQSEAATGKSPYAAYWLHCAFLMVDGKKMSKSLGNYFTIEDVVKKGYDPIALRYLYLTSHYSDPLNFTWDSLGAAQTALTKLRAAVSSLKSEEGRTILSPEKNEKVDMYRTSFMAFMADDLATPRAIATIWEMLKTNIPSEDKYDLLMSFDEVLGLNLKNNVSEEELSSEVVELVKEREKLRAEGKYDEADIIRQKLHDLGYSPKDGKIK